MKETYRGAPSAHLLIKRRSKDAHLCSEHQVLSKIITQNQYLPIDSWLAVLAKENHSLYQTGILENIQPVIIMKKDERTYLEPIMAILNTQ